MLSRASRWIGLTVAASLLIFTTTSFAKEATSPKATIASALKMLLDGEYQKYIDTHCHPDACSTDAAKKSLIRYNFPATTRRAGPCLKQGNTVDVKKTKGDPNKDKEIKVFIDCGDKRMPPPATLRKHSGKWMIYRFSW